MIFVITDIPSASAGAAGRTLSHQWSGRATFIVGPDNTIQHVSVNKVKIGRNPEEVLRILDGLQTAE